jgi:hypothetical protein
MQEFTRVEFDDVKIMHHPEKITITGVVLPELQSGFDESLISFPVNQTGGFQNENKVSGNLDMIIKSREDNYRLGIIRIENIEAESAIPHKKIQFTVCKYAYELLKKASENQIELSDFSLDEKLFK